MISFARCFTGRRWVNICRGFLAIGFGPDAFIERIHWRDKLVYANRAAYMRGVLRRNLSD